MRQQQQGATSSYYRNWMRHCLTVLLVLTPHRGTSFIRALHHQSSNNNAVVQRGGSTVWVPPAATNSSTCDKATSSSSSSNATEVDGAFVANTEVSWHALPDPSESNAPLKVLFLSSDTGGGHRASAESLARQFELHYPGTTFELFDIWTPCRVRPYKDIVPIYQHMSANPNQWRILYHMSNSLPWELLTDWHSATMCEKKITESIMAKNPDVIVSVHPAMNRVPLVSARKLSVQTGRHVPFFTVVTDLGSAHTTWFQKKVDKLYVASERLYRLARRRGRTPANAICRTGLPIRHDFSVQASQLQDRRSASGQAYQRAVRKELLLDQSEEALDRPVILLMGGGEGVGSLAEIVDELYAALVHKGMSATILVVCGRNENLQNDLANRDWDQVAVQKSPETRRSRQKRRRRLFGRTKRKFSEVSNVANATGNVQVVGLGFVTNMAEYMVASDILVTKAGPGTLAEAASLGLPVLMTSFLPGQEAGNVDFVLEKGFGDYIDDPVHIGDEVSVWLQDPARLSTLSEHAQQVGHPDAASEIVQDIGSITHTWKALNGA